MAPEYPTANPRASPPPVSAVLPIRSDLPNLWPGDLMDDAVKQAVADLHALLVTHLGEDRAPLV